MSAFFFKYHSVLVIVALSYDLLSENTMSLIFFCQNIVLVIEKFFGFTQFLAVFSMLLENTLKTQIFSKKIIFIILIIPVYKHGIFFHFLCNLFPIIVIYDTQYLSLNSFFFLLTWPALLLFFVFLKFF